MPRLAQTTRVWSVAGQKPQHVLRRTHVAPQLFPELLSSVQFAREHLAKGVFQDFDSGQKAVPGSAQTAGLDQPRRRIEPTAHLRLGVEESLQAPRFQWSISQPSARQHGDRVATTHAQKALHSEAFPSNGFAEAHIETVTMEPS